MNSFTRRFSASLPSLLFFTGLIDAQTVTRTEVLATARAFAEHRWHAGAQHVRHGVDDAGIEIHPPNEPVAGPAAGDSGRWRVGEENVGMPYKWGGFDTVASFDAGLRAGKAAGDLYSFAKRRRGNAAVSSAAVGIDCSGFVSRCWKLPFKHGTGTLCKVCQSLDSPADLRPGDIMNVVGGHVVIFARWLDDRKTRALFYEAEPFSKVTAREYKTAELTASGFRPLRYKHIVD
jgi:hypothetical protein